MVARADSYRLRVAALRDSWAERRAIRRLGTATDFESQLAFLQAMHSWAADCIGTIVAVYGQPLAVLSPLPGATAGAVPAFTATIAGQYTAVFSLEQRGPATNRRWEIAATVSGTPEPRAGQRWTRARIEDTLLSLLGTYERSAAMEAGLRGR